MATYHTKPGFKKVQYVLKEETVEAVKRDAKSLGMTGSSYVNMVLMSVSRAASELDAAHYSDLFAYVIAEAYEAQKQSQQEAEED